MSKLPQVKSQEIIKVLRKLDFEVVRQTGSHIRLYHPDGRRVSVPRHNRPLFIDTLHSILRQAKLSREEFLKLHS